MHAFGICTGMMRAGEGDYVLDQFAKAWGWALTQCDTTWLEASLLIHMLSIHVIHVMPI